MDTLLRAENSRDDVMLTEPNYFQQRLDHFDGTNGDTWYGGVWVGNPGGYGCMCICVYVCVFMRMFMFLRMRMCVDVCVCVCVRACMHGRVIQCIT